MSAFLKIDDCRCCRRSLPWEWVPVILLNGKTLAGTGVWRSSLTEGYCDDCLARRAAEERERSIALRRRAQLVHLLSGERPFRDFTFDRFEKEAGNRAAFERCVAFDPSCDNLYLWGPCGTGKTHLAYAIARRAFEETLSVEILRPPQLVRRARMRRPDEEQSAVDRLVQAEVLVVDEMGVGTDSAYCRQLLQEVLDARHFHDRAGLVMTSAYPLDALAQRLCDDTIPSRIAGMCEVVRVAGSDRRLPAPRSNGSSQE
jgi:DNA replication protein DnaC